MSARIDRWVVVGAHGTIVTGLLRERAQCEPECALYDRSHPHRAPHRAVRLVETPSELPDHPELGGDA